MYFRNILLVIGFFSAYLCTGIATASGSTTLQVRVRTFWQNFPNTLKKTNKSWILNPLCQPKTNKVNPTREKLRGLLNKLAKTTRPIELRGGAATCQLLGNIGIRYIKCSACNQATNYDITHSYGFYAFKTCLNLVESIKNEMPDLDIKMVTTDFCPKCSPDKAPNIGISRSKNDIIFSGNKILSELDSGKSIDELDSDLLLFFKEMVGASLRRPITRKFIKNRLRNLNDIRVCDGLQFRDKLKLEIRGLHASPKVVRISLTTLRALDALVKKQDRFLNILDGEIPVIDHISDLRALLDIYE